MHENFISCCLLRTGDRERCPHLPLEEEIEGVTIYRCKHPANRDNIFVRGLEHFYLPYYYFKKFREIGKKYDVCLLYIPSLPLYYLAKKIKRYDGTPSVLNFQDFHPQELTDVGVLKNLVMIKILEHIEGGAYRHADHITVPSHGGIAFKERQDRAKMNRMLSRNDKASNILGYTPQTEFRKGLEQMYQWFVENWKNIEKSAEF